MGPISVLWFHHNQINMFTSEICTTSEQISKSYKILSFLASEVQALCRKKTYKKIN